LGTPRFDFPGGADMPLELPVIRIAPNAPTFDLPVLVGLEQGFFNELGIDVRYSARYEDKENTHTEREVLSRLKESLYECGSADTFTLCEWGGIDRIERGSRGGRIGALRAAVTAQAILTFDETLQEPDDLSGVPVGCERLYGVTLDKPANARRRNGPGQDRHTTHRCATSAHGNTSER
jgi:NitT/TauT family transport system substrate-binding protein